MSKVTLPPIRFRNDFKSVNKKRLESSRQSVLSNIHAGKTDPAEWIQDNCYVNGHKISFTAPGGKQHLGDYDIESKIMHRPYIYGYLRDTADEKSVIKPRQSEFTVTNINQNLYNCLINKCNVEHVFPTDKIATNISREKISPAIHDSPTLGRRLVGTGNVHSYQFPGPAFYSISGALDKAAGRATSRDFILFDEWDEIPESVAGVFLGQLEHSQWQKSGYVSTATVPEIGIDAKVKQGCEFEHYYQCQHCDEWQTFTFPESIINFFEVSHVDPEDPKYFERLNKTYFGCIHCKEPVDRNGKHYLKTAHWKAKKRHLIGIKSSYYVTAAMLAWKTAKEILMAYHFYYKKGMVYQFFNEKWGTAFMESGRRLEESEMFGLTKRYAPFSLRNDALSCMSIGIDWGKFESWLVISARGIEAGQYRRSIIYTENICAESLKENGFTITDETQHVKRAIQIIKRFRPDIVVDDPIGIGIDRHAELRREFPELVYGGQFDTQEKNKQILQSAMLEPTWSESQHKVTIPKVKLVKEIINEIRAKDVGYPLLSGDKEQENFRNFTLHHHNLGVQTRYDEKTERSYELVVKFGPDHYFDADMYSKVGFDELYGKKGSMAVPGIA